MGLFCQLKFLNSKLSHDFFGLCLHTHTQLPSRTNILMSAGRGKRNAAAMARAEEGLTRHTIPPYTPPHAAPHTNPPTIGTPLTLPTLHAYLRPLFLQQNSRSSVREKPRVQEKVHRFLSSTLTRNPVPSTAVPTPSLPPFMRRFHYVTSCAALYITSSWDGGISAKRS